VRERFSALRCVEMKLADFIQLRIAEAFVAFASESGR
jgi:hypothetical protein